MMFPLAVDEDSFLSTFPPKLKALGLSDIAILISEMTSHHWSDLHFSDNKVTMNTFSDVYLPSLCIIGRSNFSFPLPIV